MQARSVKPRARPVTGGCPTTLFAANADSVLGVERVLRFARSTTSAQFVDPSRNTCEYVDLRDEANEGKALSGLAIALRTLRRLDEARQEIRRSIKCGESVGHAIEPWKFWSILADIETDAGNPAAEAKGKAIACYLAYRRDGGENHYADGDGGAAIMSRRGRERAIGASETSPQTGQHAGPAAPPR